MTNTAVLDYKGDKIDIVIEAIDAEKQQDGSYHLIAPNSRFIGVLREDEEKGYLFKGTVESDGDRIILNIPDKTVEGFLDQVTIKDKTV